jgi:hypothetical protein
VFRRPSGAAEFSNGAHKHAACKLQGHLGHSLFLATDLVTAEAYLPIPETQHHNVSRMIKSIEGCYSYIVHLLCAYRQQLH